MPPADFFRVSTVGPDLDFMEFLGGLEGGISRARSRVELRICPLENPAFLRRHGGDDHDSLGERRLIGQCDIEPGRHPFRRNLSEPPQGAAGQPHRGLPRSQIDDPEVAPKYAVAKPGAERFRTGFLGSKSTGIAGRAVGAPIAFATLGIGENAVEKAIAEALDRLLDATDIDHVAADAEDHRTYRGGAQPRARSTELMTGVARNAAMIVVRCLTSATSMSIMISKKSVERLVIFRLLILPPCLPITVVRLPRLPGSLAIVTLRRPTWLASSSLLQATSSQRSGVSAKLSRVSQSIVWIVTPFPVVTIPTMRSPGNGWQQPAKCSAMPGMRPRIGTAVSLRFARRRARSSEMTLAFGSCCCGNAA